MFSDMCTISKQKEVTAHLLWRGSLLILKCKGDDKPGYVVDGHLSRLPVARQLKRPT